MSTAINTIRTSNITPPIGGENRGSNISPPIGGKKRGRPPKPSSMTNIAAGMRISLRSLERGQFVKRYGVPELFAMVQRGELKLGPAEYLARFDHDLQRNACARGPNAVRKFVSINRPRATAASAEIPGLV
jgi:hypothetical protein